MALSSSKAACRGSSFMSARPCQASVIRPSASGARRPLNVVARAKAAGVGIFGTKAGMMSYFTPDGSCYPATVIALEKGNMVTMTKTQETDGYNAVQVGYKEVPEKNIKNPELGHLKKNSCPPLRHLREFKLGSKEAVEAYQPGQALDIQETFKVGDLVDVAGTTIGKGFQGTIKRWNHHRGYMTHGSKSHRGHGTVGAGTDPARSFPGLKMAGRMGNSRTVIKQQSVLKVDTERGCIVIKGCVPGKPGNIIEITPAKIVGVNC